MSQAMALVGHELKSNHYGSIILDMIILLDNATVTKAYFRQFFLIIVKEKKS